MSAYADVFWGILIFSFGLFTLLAGLFTAYFGAGKSRAIGFVLTLVGIAAMLLFSAFTWNLVPDIITPFFLDNQQAILWSLMGVLASAAGAVLALVVFLVSIMKA